MVQTLEIYPTEDAVLSDAEANLLTTPQIEHYWPFIVKELRLVQHTWDTWWTEDAFYEYCVRGLLQVWAVGSATQIKLVVFTQVVQFPANRVLECVQVLGNSFDELFPMLMGTLHKYAFDMGCDLCEVRGRDGWERKLRGCGFRKHSVVLMRRVERVVEQ